MNFHVVFDLLIIIKSMPTLNYPHTSTNVFFFLIIGILTTLTHTTHILPYLCFLFIYLIHRLVTGGCQQSYAQRDSQRSEFDIARNVLDLIYGQTLVWYAMSTWPKDYICITYVLHLDRVDNFKPTERVDKVGRFRKRTEN